MLGMTLLVIIITLALPYTPLAGPLGFTPLPVTYLLAIAVIVGFIIILVIWWLSRRRSAVSAQHVR